MTFSLFGDKFTRHSGITRLMEDLNDGLRTPGAIMLGGGNPAQIPEMNDYFQQLLADMLDNGKALMRFVIMMVHRAKASCWLCWRICCATSWAGRSNHRILR
ncbi:Valine-pyruvate aminotransferase [Klebsiella pneumoniae]|uniref:Valine-pyruvate aminotransferase n=1 Tax=Klebsiella pneumoniae TaxID=573 RepID=A0A2X3C5D5_KLEPN|nr:Valine-pyruvate aminotransferase [Klebsiella pneumoniae]